MHINYFAFVTFYSRNCGRIVLNPISILLQCIVQRCVLYNGIAIYTAMELLFRFYAVLVTALLFIFL